MNANHCNENILNTIQKNENENTTMNLRCKTLIGLHYDDIIYESYISDYYRIETGRYTRPKTPRNERICLSCNVLDDEYHALFICLKFISLRNYYRNFLTEYSSVTTLLNPKSKAH